jgi:tetratricopeptide (TPR) repeat protein
LQPWLSLLLLAIAACSPRPGAVRPVDRDPLPLSTHSPSAARAFWRAYVDLLNHFEGRAAGALDTALAIDSGFGLARVLRAHPGYLATATRYSPDQRTAEIRRGLADLERAGASASERLLARSWAAQAAAQPREAATLLDSAAAMRATDPFLLLEAAKARHALLASEGLRALDSVARRFPAFAPTYMPLAYALEQSGDTARAIAAAERYRDLAPEQPYAHYVLARLLIDARRYKQAADALLPTLRLPRSWFDPYEQLATAYQLAGESGEARALLRGPSGDDVAPLDRVNRMRYAGVSLAFDGDLAGADSALLGAASAAESLNLPDHAAFSLWFAALIQGELRRAEGVAHRLARVGVSANAGDSAQHHVFAAQAFALAGQEDSVNVHLAAVQGQLGGASADESRLRLARIIIALRDARSGHAREALDTLARLGPSTGAPMVFLARDDAFAAVGDTSSRVSEQAAWLAARNVNLRSVPLALAWHRARGTPRRAGTAAPPA